MAGLERARAHGGEDVGFDALERRLDVRRRARTDARKEDPPSDGAEFGASEIEMARTLSGLRARIEGRYAEAAARLAQDVRRLAPPAPDLAGSAARTRLALNRVEGAAKVRFQTQRRHVARARGELDAFRDRHARVAPASYPSSPLLAGAILLAAALFESAFSASLFASEQDSGLLGGAVIAVGLSGANVAFGVLAGFLGFRYLGHVSLVRRIGGALTAAGFFVLALGLNLYAATWRDQSGLAERLIADDREVMGLLKRAITPPEMEAARFLGLSAPEATILLMLAAAVWVFAALKGYSGLDDPYPDYGKLDRAVRSAEADLEDMRAALREQLEAPVAQAEADVAGRLEAMAQAHRGMRAAYDAGAAALADQAARLRQLDDAEDRLFALYRRENASARTTPAPARFAEPPPPRPMPPDGLAAAGDAVAEADAALARARADAAGLLDALGADCEAATARLEAEP